MTKRIGALYALSRDIVTYDDGEELLRAPTVKERRAYEAAGSEES